jgi:hypothetical protein
MYGNLAGTWRMAWPLKLSVANQSVIADDTASSVATATLQTDGRLKLSGTDVTTSYVDFTDNAPDTDKGGAAPTLFQYKWETNPGTPDTVPATVSTWTDLTADAIWQNGDNGEGGGPNLDKFALHIRAKDATASTITFNITLSAEYESGGP